MKRTVAILLACWCFSGMSFAKGKDPKIELSGLDSLTEREGSFELALVQPGVDPSRYQNVLVRDVEFEFRKIESGPDDSTGRLLGSRSKPRTKPNRKELTKYREIIRSSLVDELETCEGLHVVDEPVPGTLILQPMVTDMISVLPPKNAPHPDGQVQLLAEGVIVLDLIDAETGVIQARVGDRRRAVHVWNAAEDGKNVDLWTDVGNWANRAAADLLTELQTVLNQGENGESADS